MLIAAIRTGHALAGKAVTYNEEDGRFWLTGSGEIPAARLLEYDDRRELDWADDVTREWALEMASILARKQAAQERQHEAAAAAATAEAARLEALAPPSVVYPPPDTTPLRPEGIPAVAPTFELSSEARDRRPRWVVWAEAAPDAAAATGGTEAPAGQEVAAAPPRHAITAPGQTPGPARTGPFRRRRQPGRMRPVWSRSRHQRLRPCRHRPRVRPDRRIAARDPRMRRLSRHRATSGAARSANVPGRASAPGRDCA